MRMRRANLRAMRMGESAVSLGVVQLPEVFFTIRLPFDGIPSRSSMFKGAKQGNIQVPLPAPVQAAGFHQFRGDGTCEAWGLCLQLLDTMWEQQLHPSASEWGAPDPRQRDTFHEKTEVCFCGNWFAAKLFQKVPLSLERLRGRIEPLRPSWTPSSYLAQPMQYM